MDRKRKWDEPAEPSLDGTTTNAAAVDSPMKIPKTEDSHGPAAAAANDGADKAAEAAAAIAARLASQYRGGGGGAPPPPPGSAPPPPPGASTAAGSFGGVGHKGERDRDREAGLHVEDIEINDLRNRYLLTKGPTQQQILADTGANVLTRGVWYPDKSMATEKDPPLYLHITGDTPEKLEAGVKAVRALIDQDLNLLAGGPRGRHMGPPGQQGGPDADRDSGYGQRRRWPEEKVMIDLEPLRNFNVRAKVVGPGGMFVKYIQQETGTRVQIKGQGSGYIETDTGRESDDPMHVNIAGPEPQQIERAVELAKDLLEVIREKHAEALQHGPPQFGGGGGQYGHGGAGFPPSGPNGYGGPGGRFGGPPPQQQQMDPYAQQQQNPYNYQPNQYAGAGLTAPLPPGEAPPPPPGGGGEQQQQQQGATSAAPAGGAAASGMSNEQYMAWWNSLDAASQAYYTQYYAAYAQYAANPAAAASSGAAGGTPQGSSNAGASASPAPPSSAPPPPPPPSDAPPPPPPSAGNEGGGSGRYGAVPPPAGL
ncbi:hypothetical protein BMF94_6001 [Rhodotorula taiwanensis]|uniref:K Homology domain-containing protein n=1 Tax=Rhodotorula taiwanensis TaxID=741276 RepID=A0A2S5B2H0_9BASI|nr:hypothetical protein BMF94_6001 [Rhodotorula taiwanensis]